MIDGVGVSVGVSGVEVEDGVNEEVGTLVFEAVRVKDGVRVGVREGVKDAVFVAGWNGVAENVAVEVEVGVEVSVGVLVIVPVTISGVRLRVGI